MPSGDTVSIIVPVYKAEEYITDTIENVLSQTYSDWELILINDNSPDASEARIKEYIDSHSELINNRIKLISKENNEGAAAARNTGIEEAAGRYIAFLDADDVWKNDRLAKSLAVMKEKSAGFVFSAYEFGDENANGTGRIVHVPETLTYKRALSRTVIFTSTTLFDTEIVPKELIKMPLVESEDTATWWQILKAGYTAYGINEVLAIYRRPAKSLSSNKLIAIKRIWNLYRNVEELSLIQSLICFIGWAYRATVRRI